MRRLVLFPVFSFCLVNILALGGAAASPGDPIEPVNRGIFWFNEKVDSYLVEPTARGWDFVAPDPVQQGISNFFTNLRFPIVAVNHLLQGKVEEFFTDVARFQCNTIAGLLGFFDVAARAGLEAADEDFGQTLGYWGVPPGPYLVLPLFGPSSLRDGTGRVVDSFAAVYPWFVPFIYTIGPHTLNLINFRAQLLGEVDEAKRTAVDYYAFVRNAYLQRRRRLVADTVGMTEEEQEQLYYFDEE
jgi:phospholipid-binding lipoprotein MlaA